jgi:tetratricopeptide (TPR) repeat protein
LIISALAVFGQYGWKLLWPAKLCAYYVFPGDVAALYPWALGGVVALAICLIAFAGLRKSSPQAAFGVIWFLATLAPVLNVRWMTSNAFAERYLYLASIGFCWMVGWGGIQAWKSLSARGNKRRFALPVAACVLAALAAVRITTRNGDWRDNVTFYTATLAVSPGAYYIHNNLGTEYWSQGNVPAAEKEWREALRLAPGSEYALHNLALVDIETKHYQEAEALLQSALAVRPDYSDAHLDLGRTFEATGRLPEAEEQMVAAEKLSPLNVRVRNTLSEFYFDRRRLPEAEAEARRSLEIEPTTQAYWDLGLVEWLKGDRPAAERAFLGALALAPSGRAHFMLGLFYMDSARPADALREYRAGLQLDPTNVDALANLQKLEWQSAQH